MPTLSVTTGDFGGRGQIGSSMNNQGTAGATGAAGASVPGANGASANDCDGVIYPTGAASRPLLSFSNGASVLVNDACMGLLNGWIPSLQRTTSINVANGSMNTCLP